jgi:hypothetical protein
MNSFSFFSAISVGSNVFSDFARPAAFVAIAIGLLGILAARGIQLQFWVWRLRYLVIAGVSLLACQLLAYFTVFDRCESLTETRDGTNVLLVGNIESVHEPEAGGGETIFVLSDPTGRITVRTTNGPPAKGSICIVRGHKETRVAAPIVVCEFRLSSWGKHNHEHH